MKSIELISGLEILSKIETQKIKGGVSNYDYMGLILDVATVDTTSNKNQNFSPIERKNLISKADSTFQDSSK